jgi:hypothetical protein
MTFISLTLGRTPFHPQVHSEADHAGCVSIRPILSLLVGAFALVYVIPD